VAEIVSATVAARCRCGFVLTVFAGPGPWDATVRAEFEASHACEPEPPSEIRVRRVARGLAKARP
jgi:hypothetical protein